MFSLVVFLAVILSVNGDIYDDSDEIDGRIVGGQAQAIATRNFQVGLIVGENFCGGSLILSNWVLTAGHCVENLIPADVSARAGSIFLDSGGDTRSASALFPHPDFNSVSLDSDIALIKLISSFTLSSTIGTIPLAGIMPLSGFVTVSGFGSTSETGPNSDTLQSVTIPILSEDQCFSDYGNDLTDSMFCAGQAGFDHCYGDSGGPVTFNGTLLGVVSWAYECAGAFSPGINTKVPNFISWIQSTVKNN